MAEDCWRALSNWHFKENLTCASLALERISVTRSNSVSYIERNLKLKNNTFVFCLFAMCAEKINSKYLSTCEIWCFKWYNWENSQEFLVCRSLYMHHGIVIAMRLVTNLQRKKQLKTQQARVFGFLAMTNPTFPRIVYWTLIAIE